MQEYGHSKFLHDKHVKEHKVDCLSCHIEIEHGNIQMTKPLEVSCEQCHGKSHSLQKEMYMGAGGKGVRDIPSRMFAAQVSCDGCHTSVTLIKQGGRGILTVGEKSTEAEKKSCVVCHGKGYDLMLDDWKRVMDNEVKNFAPALQMAEDVVRKSLRGGKDLKQAKELLEDARFNYIFVKDGKGVHNVEYAVKLLQTAADQIDTALKFLNKDARPIARDALLGTPDNYCLTLCHARIGLPEKLRFENMTLDFTHAVHAKDLGIECTRCHSPEKHKMRIIEKEGCMTCHHEQQDIACEHCHQSQKLFQQGASGGYGISKKMPDVMAESVECKGCHDLTKKDHTIAAIKYKCVECHEKGYDKKLLSWEKELLSAQTALTFNLAETLEKIAQAKKARKDTRQAETFYQEAAANLQMVEKAKGAHNPSYARVLLNQATLRLNQIQDILKK
jgi:hypothetical protein